MSDQFNFRRGSEAAEEASLSQAGGKFSKLDYFTIKDSKDPTRIVRFVTDVPQWITTTMHPNMPTRPAPAGFKGKWPEAMGCVCRMDSYKGQRTFPQHADCFHCITPQADNKPRRKNERTWGIGILREQYPEVVAKMHPAYSPVIGPDGLPQLNPDGSPMVYAPNTPMLNPDGSQVMETVILMRDVERIYLHTKEDGTTEERKGPHYVIFCQAWSNFWSTLDDHYKMRQTILDRDWKITRKGFSMNDTDYGIVPFEPVTVLIPGTTEPRLLDFRDPEVLKIYSDIPSLGEFVANQASDEFYDKFFDTRHPQPSFGKDSAAAAGAAAAPATAVVTPATEPAHVLAVQSIADRISGVPGVQNVTGYGPQAGTAAPAGLTSLPPQS